MKSFKAYLTESYKTYDFRVRFACEVTEETITKMKRALETYKVESVSKPKRTPIHETPLFPNMGPVEVTTIDITVCYPANDDLIRNVIAECGCAPAACIKVSPTDSPYEAILAGTEVSNKDGGVVLEEPELTTDKVDPELVGDARIPSLIKELEETRKYQYTEAEGGDSPKAKTTNDLPVGRASPVGTHRNKVPVARGMKAGNGK